MFKQLFRFIAVTGMTVSVLCISSTAIAETQLEIAYKKEYAFLDQQRKSLDKQLSALKENVNRQEASLNSKIKKLKSQLIKYEVETDNLQNLLADSERTLEEKNADDASLEQLFEQAQASINKKTISGDSVLPLFQAGVSLLSEQVRVQKTQGEFFLQDGAKVSGEIVKIGQIAQFASSAEGAGALAPAGGGNLKLWGEDSGGSLAAIERQENSGNIKLFLYENSNQAVEDLQDKTLVEIVESGGIIAWIIVAAGGLAIIMILLRMIFLKRASVDTVKLVKEIRKEINGGKINDALTVCQKRKGATARVVSATLRNIDKDRDHLEDVVAESILHEQPFLNRYGAAILVIAAVAPLMGLLGTVTGMIATFDVITKFGTGDPKLLSGGISTALVTTQLGLIVAIPALIAGNMLSGWSNRIKDDMEKAALSVINVYSMHKVVSLKPAGKGSTEAA